MNPTTPKREYTNANNKPVFLETDQLLSLVHYSESNNCIEHTRTTFQESEGVCGQTKDTLPGRRTCVCNDFNPRKSLYRKCKDAASYGCACAPGNREELEEDKTADARPPAACRFILTNNKLNRPLVPIYPTRAYWASTLEATSHRQR